MLDDAAYYARRERDERALAEACSDLKVRDVHLLLAGKYSKLAQRALATLTPAEHLDGPSVGSHASTAKRAAARHYR